MKSSDNSRNNNSRNKKLNPIEAEIEITVPFHDVDSMKIVWHGHYVRYFELARCELLESFDYGYVEMADSGYAWPVIEVQAKYVKPLIYRQTVIVKATLRDWNLRLKIDYVIHDKATGARLTKGHSVQVAVDPVTNEMCMPLPSSFQQNILARFS